MLQHILQSLNVETLVFILVITCFWIGYHVKFTPATVYKAPAVLTTFGILGTFFGIGIGLTDFDPNNIQNSVPALINGIKTAVWASAWGIFCALTIKIRETLTGIRKKITASKASGATIDDLASILTGVQQALVGNDDSTLLSQMKLARQDSNDRLDKLARSMDEFCNKMAENNSKALIDALKEVLRDFNTKINEQFGDNFKQLNQAVEKILVWQEQYRQQMSEMIQQQTVTTQNMSVAVERYEGVVKNADTFTQTAKSMSQLLGGLEAQRIELNQSLTALANLINTAAAGYPEIEKKITEMTRQISDGVRTTNDELKTVLLNVVHSSNKEFNDNIKKIIDKTKEQVVTLDNALSEELTKSLETFGRQMASLSQKFAQDYTPITERLQTILKAVA